MPLDVGDRPDQSHLPMLVGDGHLMATVLCKCDKTNAPMMIRGVDAGMRCLRCGAMYVIVAAEFDQAAGKRLKVTVAQMVDRQTAAPATTH